MKQVGTLKDQRYSTTPTDEFWVLECQQCGVGKTDPVPNNIDEYYIEEYYENRVEENSNNGTLYQFLNKIDQTYEATVGIASLLPDDTQELLVVGCGPGNKLHQYKRKGINVTGVEPNKKAVQFGRDKYDLEIKHGSLTDDHIIETLSEYDVVLFDHVFEHIPNPRENLAVVRNSLKPTGSLLIEVPNFDSLSRQLFSKYWGDYDVPRHIYHYTPAALEELLSQCGFKLDEESYDLSARLHAFWFAKLLKEEYQLNFPGRVFYPIFGIYGMAGGLLKKTRFRHCYKIV